MKRSALLETAIRTAGVHDDATVIDDLRAGLSVTDCSKRRGLSPAAVSGVRSFYSFLDGGAGVRRCTGAACAFAQGSLPSTVVAGADTGPRVATKEPDSSSHLPHPVRCVGRCYEAPVVVEPGHFPIPRRSLVDPPMIFRNLMGTPPDLRELYALHDPEWILQVLDQVGLRGRGGAAYPTGAKWRAARDAHGSSKVVVANGDEGDPGSFVDRLLLEEDPHAILAGIQCCARAIGAEHAVVYIRGEYPRAAEVMRGAIGEAAAHGLLADGLHVEVHVGAGSYVCGEETALLRAIEGLRAEPRPKPPYPAQEGLYGRPTVVQNVETLAVVPELLRARRRPSTKAFSLSGAVALPGAVEAELGIPLIELLERGADGVRTGARWKMALIGGPMGRVIPIADFDVRMGYDTLPGLGHGGVVVLDESVGARDLAEHLFAFAASESCGSCTPCRVGTSMLTTRQSRSELERLLETLEMGSLCGFGLGVPRPIRDLLAHFPEEMQGGASV
jgi:NADH:ubiquinone oxidoreductase subunit F (NADH-binding)